MELIITSAAPAINTQGIKKGDLIRMPSGRRKETDRSPP